MYRQSIQFQVKDAALREDVHALGGLIGETLRDQGGEEFFNLVEGDRLAALKRRRSNDVPPTLLTPAEPLRECVRPPRYGVHYTTRQLHTRQARHCIYLLN